MQQLFQLLMTLREQQTQLQQQNQSLAAQQQLQGGFLTLPQQQLQASFLLRPNPSP